MELKLNSVTEEQITQFFLQDCTLCSLSLEDHVLVGLYGQRKYLFNPDDRYVGIFNKTRLIGIGRWNYFTPNTANVHIYINSSLHGKGVTKIAWGLFVDMLAQEGFTNLIILVPTSCEHVSKKALGLGLEYTGKVKNSIQWRNRIEDLNIYHLTLKEE